MESLKHYQENFIDHIIHPEASNCPSRFNIYRNNWLFGLLKSLIHLYPVCERLTGNEFFQSMALQYIKSNCSTSFSLNYYGNDFFAFVKNFKPAASLPYLSDVAKLEWAVHKASIGESNRKLERSEILKMLNAIDKSIDLRLTLVKNGCLITSEYPIHKIWETNQDGYVGETIINLNEGNVWLLVWREELELRIDILEREAWELLSKVEEINFLPELLGSEFVDNKFLSLLEKSLPIFIEKGYLSLESNFSHSL